MPGMRSPSWSTPVSIACRTCCINGRYRGCPADGGSLKITVPLIVYSRTLCRSRRDSGGLSQEVEEAGSRGLCLGGQGGVMLECCFGKIYGCSCDVGVFNGSNLRLQPDFLLGCKFGRCGYPGLDAAIECMLRVQVIACGSQVCESC